MHSPQRLRFFFVWTKGKKKQTNETKQNNLCIEFYIENNIKQSEREWKRNEKLQSKGLIKWWLKMVHLPVLLFVELCRIPF